MSRNHYGKSMVQSGAGLPYAAMALGIYGNYIASVDQIPVDDTDGLRRAMVSTITGVKIGVVGDNTDLDDDQGINPANRIRIDSIWTAPPVELQEPDQGDEEERRKYGMPSLSAEDSTTRLVLALTRGLDMDAFDAYRFVRYDDLARKYKFLYPDPEIPAAVKLSTEWARREQVELQEERQEIQLALRRIDRRPMARYLDHAVTTLSRDGLVSNPLSILQAYANIASYDVLDMIEEDQATGLQQLRRFRDMPRRARMAIKEITFDKETGAITGVKLHSRTSALDKLFKYHVMIGTWEPLNQSGEAATGDDKAEILSNAAKVAGEMIGQMLSAARQQQQQYSNSSSASSTADAGDVIDVEIDTEQDVDRDIERKASPQQIEYNKALTKGMIDKARKIVESINRRQKD